MKKIMQSIILVTAEVEIPEVPYFLRMTDGKQLPASAIGIEGLHQIGKIWTETLISHANEQSAEAEMSVIDDAEQEGCNGNP